MNSCEIQHLDILYLKNKNCYRYMCFSTFKMSKTFCQYVQLFYIAVVTLPLHELPGNNNFITYLHVVVKGYHGEGFVIRQFSVIYFHRKNSCVKVYTIQTFCCHQQPYWQRMTIQQKGAISNVQLRISSYTALRLRQTTIRKNKNYNDSYGN